VKEGKARTRSSALYRVLVDIYQDPDFVSCLIILIIWKMKEDYDES